jgi:hypothetical protein
VDTGASLPRIRRTVPESCRDDRGAIHDYEPRATAGRQRGASAA